MVPALVCDCTVVQSACLASWAVNNNNREFVVVGGGGGSWGKNVV